LGSRSSAFSEFRFAASQLRCKIGFLSQSGGEKEITACSTIQPP